MDLFVAICTGLGLAIAAGLVIGAVVGRANSGWIGLAAAAGLGVLACALALSGADESILPAPVGALGAVLAASVSGAVAAGAARRAGGSSPTPVAESAASTGSAKAVPTGVLALVVVAAAVIAGLALLWGPISLVALAAIGWLATTRRRVAGEKYEGLRVLR